MKLLKQIKTIEVKRAFVVADLVSSKENRRQHLNFVPENILREKIKTATQKVLKLRESALDKIIKSRSEKRLIAYNDSKWYLGEVKTSEVGVWRRAADLPLSFTNGSLAETATKVKQALQKNPKLLKKRSRYTIPNILKTNINLFQQEKYLLPIMFEGGTGTKGRRRLKRQMKADIDDGSMRSIALAISGKKAIRAYIGFPK